MYNETLKKLIGNAIFKRDMVKKDFFRYFVLSILAGIYIGIAIFLVFSIGAPLYADGSPMTKTLLGVTFSVGLILIVFAGAELFTGNTMCMSIASLSGEISWSDTAIVWLVCFAGNLVGGILFAGILKISGLLNNSLLIDYINYYASIKMNLTVIELFFRGILCNMMVCLALWMCSRTKEDTAKLILIFWCLFAFVSSGFEHSVANMSFLAMALFAEPTIDITWLGYLKNLTYVTLGNIVGGALCVGWVYWYISGSKKIESKTKTTQKKPFSIKNPFKKKM